MRKKKQIIRVYEAVSIGAQTSTEVSAVSNLPLHHCSAYLRELELAGMIENTGIRYFDKRRSLCWMLKTNA